MSKNLAIYAVEYPLKRKKGIWGVLDLKPSSHSYLALVDADTMEPQAEIHFAAFYRNGQVSKRISRSPLNLIASLSPSKKLDKLYVDLLRGSFLSNSLSYIKAKMTRGRSNVRDLDRQEIASGKTQDVISEWERMWDKACIISHSEIPFTCIGFFRSATNCRAGTEALIQQRAPEQKLSIGGMGRGRALYQGLSSVFNPVAMECKDEEKIDKAKDIIRDLKAKYVQQNPGGILFDSSKEGLQIAQGS